MTLLFWYLGLLVAGALCLFFFSPKPHPKGFQSWTYPYTTGYRSYQVDIQPWRRKWLCTWHHYTESPREQILTDRGQVRKLQKYLKREGYLPVC